MTEKLAEVDFFFNGLCMQCQMSRSGLTDFMHFHSQTEAAWKHKDNEIQNNLNEALQQNLEIHHEEIVQDFSWDIHQNQYKFPNIHRESLVITICSFLEIELNKLCSVISRSITRENKQDTHFK